jgi:hypothetical protein
MGSWLKWIFATPLAVGLLYTGFCYGFHRYGASVLDSEALKPGRHHLPKPLRAQWLAVQSDQPVEVLPRLYPVTVLPELLWAVDHRDRRSAGLTLLGHAASRRLPTHAGPAGATRRHAASLAALVIISRHWTPDDVANAALAESYFGRQAHGIEAASDAYFGLPLSELRPEESLALIVLLQSPFFYDPDCQRGRFETRYRLLAKRMSMDSGDAGLALAIDRMKPVVCTHTSAVTPFRRQRALYAA